MAGNYVPVIHILSRPRKHSIHDSLAGYGWLTYSLLWPLAAGPPLIGDWAGIIPLCAFRAAADC